GFTDVRVNVILESNADEERKNALIAHALKYSPVANTLLRQVNLEAK
ncbi:MAG: OsmC family protein, partial [Campylobacter sp.]|nr:OsmC family protein [Campylobacter sp.]